MHDIGSRNFHRVHEVAEKPRPPYLTMPEAIPLLIEGKNYFFSPRRDPISPGREGLILTSELTDKRLSEVGSWLSLW